MKNRKSFTEQTNYNTADFSSNEVSFVLDLYIQMVIDEALFNHKKNLLEKQIDSALDSNDKLQFQLLAIEYNTLIQNAT